MLCWLHFCEFLRLLFSVSFRIKKINIYCYIKYVINVPNVLVKIILHLNTLCILWVTYICDVNSSLVVWINFSCWISSMDLLCCESIHNKKYHYVFYFTTVRKFQYQILKCSMFANIKYFSLLVYNVLCLVRKMT